MLACARIGAVHSVVFGGFAAEAIADRNNDAKAKLTITSDASWRRGKQIPLKANVDAALEKSATVEKCVVYKRTGCEVIGKLGVFSSSSCSSSVTSRTRRSPSCSVRRPSTPTCRSAG